MTKQTKQIQVMKRTQYVYDVYKISGGKSPRGQVLNIYELIGRIVLDAQKDRFFVELPLWNDVGQTWKRVNKPYLVLQAALNTIADPEELN